ncbi:unnamed protein product [Plutella xylostella]|uniref:(diamondback moth) hypothetical protein n=1 Tax=Plutella xylostella TaxID=51655 RepID=A0A8S4G3F1_PLUXY|nr:unnamed protein product [Plutella xylostella]
MKKMKVGEVGRLVDSSQADDRRMIALVRTRRLLYARTNMPVASYYAQVKALWKEVADEMGWTVAEVRRKWSHIRNSYSRHLRNELSGARTGRGRAVSRWYLADDLDFLREHMATDTRSPQYSGYVPSFLTLNMSEPASPESADVKPFASPWLSSLAQPLQDYSQGNEDSSSSTAFSPDENSSYFQFFRGIYNDYQELSQKKQRKFKRYCLNFLHDLLDEEDLERAELAKTHDPALPQDPGLPQNPGLPQDPGLPHKIPSRPPDPAVAPVTSGSVKKQTVAIVSSYSLSDNENKSEVITSD